MMLMLTLFSAKMLSFSFFNFGGPGEVLVYFSLLSYLNLFSYLYTVISVIISAVFFVCNLLLLLFVCPRAGVFDVW